MFIYEYILYFSFEGEKNSTKEEKAEQILQQRVWLEMQIRDKKMAQEEDKNLERTWQETQHTTAQRASVLASLENECKKKLLEANHRYNQALVSVLISSNLTIRWNKCDV